MSCLHLILIQPHYLELRGVWVAAFRLFSLGGQRQIHELLQFQVGASVIMVRTLHKEVS